MFSIINYEMQHVWNLVVVVVVIENIFGNQWNIKDEIYKILF